MAKASVSRLSGHGPLPAQDRSRRVARRSESGIAAVNDSSKGTRPRNASNFPHAAGIAPAGLAVA
ncbi:hypothetical protein BJD12_02995 [Xanthomonas vesicatoria ATCC 35937]|uniref:Uncharacterized protein n=1 Tax=Xanthomonas vesicatoria TaxID=56460 RepID=A0AAJ0IZA2_9XANT|nr:hypothetical protein BI313_05700 [Xanthomonas vesicatoria]APP74395.1 hypothetical protein BJD12_02995 [Xanthomonas vesicatoria ATCC 35937]KHM94674.1 hypothetical protein OR60_10290 [Xanthomonas vesicatoria]KHM95782.1 hypothetical protein OR61_08055 [Xanthomonas vesicatoria]KTF31421.1 hypothetical protein LMG919_19640 [Xanthomonas vesicatoria]